MQYITFRLQTDCNQTFHSPSFSIKYVLYSHLGGLYGVKVSGFGIFVIICQYSQISGATSRLQPKSNVLHPIYP